jgi:hypothetical protein
MEENDVHDLGVGRLVTMLMEFYRIILLTVTASKYFTELK